MLSTYTCTYIYVLPKDTAHAVVFSLCMAQPRNTATNMHVYICVCIYASIYVIDMYMYIYMSYRKIQLML